MLRRGAPSSKNVDFDDTPDRIEYNEPEAEAPSPDKKDDKQFSLTLLPPQRGEIPLPNRPQVKEKTLEQKGLFDNFKKKESQESQQQIKEQRDKPSLPCPKFSKLGEMVYCVYNANIVSVYQYSKEANSRKKKLFEEKGVFTMDSEIKFVRGNKKLMLIAFENEFVIIPLEGPHALKKKIKKSTNIIVGGCFESQGEFVIITHTSLAKYYLNPNDDITTLSSHKLQLKLGSVKFIEILKDQKLGKYLLIFAEKKKVAYNNESKASFSKDEEKEVIKNGESLQIIELGFESSEEDGVYEISNIPESGIFELSKAFYLGQESILLSLFEEIIVVRKQFQKYIVVDNTAIASMSVTDDSKTGQLVLVDKQKVVYNDHEGINVYNLLYVPREDKIQMQSVDNFAAIDQSQFKLYDGVLLQSGDTNMQVLFYFDTRKISRPGKKNMILDNDEKQQEKYKLRFSVYAIVQSQPIERLIQLLKLKRPQNEINEFRTNFNISPLQFYKSQWSVSQKSLNDIINNLLQISDEEFIESELDHVLKKESTTLNFLIKIEEKQVIRLKKVIISKLENAEQIDSDIYEKQEKKQSTKMLAEQRAKNEEELIKIVKKLLESKMFLKKLRFQNEFEAYKIIDFIEINKVREMSLKEQIKLLSSKGYEKRLKQFLNQFKYLAIANFEDIFKFLMENKDEKEANEFLSKMGFMFPLANNPDKEEFDDFEDDPCILWEDFQSNHEISDKNNQGPETIDSFVTDLFPDENMKSKELRALMGDFIQTEWFKEGAFKKHCKLSIKYQQLTEEFNQLKTIKVYNILYKYLFENIREETREQIISSLLELGRLPQGFMVNMRIREQVYKLLIKLKLLMPSQMRLSDFLILSETEYFTYLTIQNAPPHMFFEDIKGIYQRVVEESHLDDLRLENVPYTVHDPENDTGTQNKGFFEQCFEKSMEGILVPVEQLKFYLNEFITIGSGFQVENQDLLQIILDAINRKFIACGNLEQILEVADLLFRIDLSEGNPQKCSVFLEIAFFNGFWKNFSLNYSFHQVNQEQRNDQPNSNAIILQAIQKYCRNQYQDAEFEIIQLTNSAYDKLEYSKKKVNIRKPTDFFQFLLFMTNQIGYNQNLNLLNLEYFLIQMLKNQRFDDITELNVELFNFVKDKDPREFLEELILKHVKQMEKDSYDIRAVYDHVVSSLNLVVPVTIRIKQERAFLDFCKYVETLDYRILSKIPNIREELMKPSLVFMMDIWTAGNIEEISYADPLKTRILMENIYEKYKETTSFDINFKARASSDAQFLEFQIERGYQYIERKMLVAALQICKLLSNQDKVYYSDLVYSLTCEVGKKMESSSEENAYAQYIKLIEFSILHNDISEVIDHLDEIMKSEQSVQFRLVNALSIISKMIKVYIGDRDISNKDKIYYQLFFNLLETKPNEAFYFLMKNKNLNIVKVIEQLKQSKDSRNNKEEIAKCLALAIYVRSLDKVVKDFYPTHSFFLEKEKELSTDRVKRDINILASKLKLIKDEGSEQVSDFLMYYYNLYMESLALSGFVDLTKIKDNLELDLDREMGHINKEYQRQKQEIQESKRKYEELMKNINAKPKAIPVPTSQQPAFRHEEPQSPVELPSRKHQRYEQIKRRELADLKKVEKEFVRQETNSNADKILQMFKEKRQNRLNNLREESNSIKEKVEEIRARPVETPRRVEIPQRPQLYTAQKLNDPAFQIRERVLERPMKERIEEQLRKRNMMQKPEKPYTQHFISRNNSEKLDESIISNMSEMNQQIANNINRVQKHQSIQHSLDQLKRYLETNGETEVQKYFKKFELVHQNQTLAKQFIKKMFQNSKTFSTWAKVIQVIIKCYDVYSRQYEIKALKLCSQFLKIDTKVDPKHLFDLSFFSYVLPNSSDQEYYSGVFDHMRTNITKLVDDNNVHALAKAFFYGMGLNKKYQNMIYIYYLDSRLQEYLNIPFNEKQEQLLIEKLRSSYSKLSYDSREGNIRELLRGKMGSKGGEKVKTLIRLVEESMNRSAKLKNVGVSKDDESLLKLLKSV